MALVIAPVGLGRRGGRRPARAIFGPRDHSRLSPLPGPHPGATIDLDAILKKIPALDTSNVAVGLDGPLGVVSGHTGEHRLAVTNLGVNPITIDTNGRVTAHVLRPATGRLVGVSTEAQTAPLVRFDVLPQGTTLIPLWVGTASVDPSLGFAVPPGVWHAQAELSIGGQRFLTPPLPFEVIDRR